MNVSPYTTYTILGMAIIILATLWQLARRRHIKERTVAVLLLLTALIITGYAVYIEQWYLTAALTVVDAIFVWAIALPADKGAA